MPYGIRKQGNRHCVYNQTTSKTVPGGCHPTSGEAKKHMAALYANVGDAKKRKSKSDSEAKRTGSSGSRKAKVGGTDRGRYTWRGR